MVLRRGVPCARRAGHRGGALARNATYANAMPCFLWLQGIGRRGWRQSLDGAGMVGHLASRACDRLFVGEGEEGWPFGCVLAVPFAIHNLRSAVAFLYKEFLKCELGFDDLERDWLETELASW